MATPPTGSTDSASRAGRTARLTVINSGEEGGRILVEIFGQRHRQDHGQHLLQPRKRLTPLAIVPTSVTVQKQLGLLLAEGKPVRQSENLVYVEELTVAVRR